jgi:serine/threonine protein phosphatase PrpC
MQVSVARSQGRRQYMEDTYVVDKSTKHVIIAGVFDGHGGDVVAKMVANEFSAMMKRAVKEFPEVSVAFHSVFSKLDEKAGKTCPSHMGTTASVCCLLGKRIWFANCGDALGMVKLKGKDSPIMVTQDHKVENEASRIRALGGFVTYDDGCARINRQLNVARSIGDHHLKPFVIPTPFITSLNFDQVEYVLLATDGLWDVYNKDSLAKEIANLKSISNDIKLGYRETMDIISRSLVEEALKKGSTDNITLIYAEPGNS